MSDKHRDGNTGTFRLADFLPYRLAVATASISRVFIESYGASHNLTIPEWRTLAVVAQFGTLSPTAVGQHTAMDKVKVSRAAQSLIAKGMLRQAKDPNDGRGRTLRLTRKGETAYARVVPIANKIQAKVFDDLTRADKAALDRVLRKITSRLEVECDAGSGEAA